MAITPYTYHYILPGFLNIIILAIFVGLLFRNFFKKRTIGTFLLIMTYTFLLGNEVLATTSFLLEAVLGESMTSVAAVLQLVGVYMLVYTINWMYFFANRHLLRDNDLFKSLYPSLLSGIVGIIGGLSIYDAFKGTAPNFTWLAQIKLENVDFHIYYPPISGPQLTLTVLVFLVGTFTYIRIMWRTFNLQRKSTDIVTKKGFRMVTISVFLLLLTGLILGSYILGLNTIAWAASLLYVIRGFIVIGAVVTGYIGWLMPEWVRRRFRGKSWITKVYTGKVTAPPIHEANLPKNSESVRVIEIAEE